MNSITSQSVHSHSQSVHSVHSHIKPAADYAGSGMHNFHRIDDSTEKFYGVFAPADTDFRRRLVSKEILTPDESALESINRHLDNIESELQKLGASEALNGSQFNSFERSESTKQMNIKDGMTDQFRVKEIFKQNGNFVADPKELLGLDIYAGDVGDILVMKKSTMKKLGITSESSLEDVMKHKHSLTLVSVKSTNYKSSILVPTKPYAFKVVSDNDNGGLDVSEATVARALYRPVIDRRNATQKGRFIEYLSFLYSPSKSDEIGFGIGDSELGDDSNGSELNDTERAIIRFMEMIEGNERIVHNMTIDKLDYEIFGPRRFGTESGAELDTLNPNIYRSYNGIRVRMYSAVSLVFVINKTPYHIKSPGY